MMIYWADNEGARMEPLTPYLIDQLERRATPLFMPFWRGAEIPTVVARDGLWKTLIQGLKCEKIFLYDSGRSEEHTSELQSLMRISYAVFCLKKKNKTIHSPHTRQKQ